MGGGSVTAPSVGCELRLKGARPSPHSSVSASLSHVVCLARARIIPQYYPAGKRGRGDALVTRYDLLLPYAWRKWGSLGGAGGGDAARSLDVVKNESGRLH